MEGAGGVRDPRKDPQPGDIVGYRDKPTREIVQRFTDACGTEWITYTIRKQCPVSSWRKYSTGAQVERVGK